MAEQWTKSARNELKKLRAARWNNIGVGLILGGGLIPYFTLAIKFLSSVSRWLLPAAGLNSPVFFGGQTSDPLAVYLFAAMTIVASLILARWAFHMAEGELRNLEE